MRPRHMSIQWRRQSPLRQLPLHLLRKSLRHLPLVKCPRLSQRLLNRPLQLPQKPPLNLRRHQRVAKTLP